MLHPKVTLQHNCTLLLFLLCFDVITKMVKCAEVHQITRPAVCEPDLLLDVVTSIL